MASEKVPTNFLGPFLPSKRSEQKSSPRGPAEPEVVFFFFFFGAQDQSWELLPSYELQHSASGALRASGRRFERRRGGFGVAGILELSVFGLEPLFVGSLDLYIFFYARSLVPFCLANIKLRLFCGSEPAILSFPLES